ncbi:MAG TPA: pilus assembly protein PilC [Lentisphaeria bacterium]|nr:MAG: pilus assembly protein PilC [Lentisphaerae bacterium GWF2_38_69]HBM14738.1 pilus assembly protein PilC [Lentisphaeria bacterium]
MAQYSYTAMNSAGKEVKGTMTANKEGEVNSALKANGYFPIEIREVSAGKKSKEKVSAVAGKKKRGLFDIQIGAVKIPPKELVLFTRQLSILLDAGLPLIRALRTLEKQARNKPVKKILGETADYVEGGFTFSEALTKNPKSFDQLYTNMIKAGESAGAMEVILGRLASFMEKLARILAKIKSAMIYPAAVMSVALGVTAFLMVVIVPKFEKIFSELMNGMPLPALTTFVMNISKIFMAYYMQIGGAIVGLIIILKITKKTKKGRFLLDALKFRMPVFGQLVSKTSITRFARTFGTLLSSGVPVLRALMIVRDTAGNGLVEKAIQKVHDAVKEGETIAAPLAATKIFPDMVISMVEVGEETGKLPEMLEKIADTYEEEVDNAVDALTSLLEPIMIVFMAVVVGTIVIAMFMPLISIMQNLGG